MLNDFYILHLNFWTDALGISSKESDDDDNN